MSNKKQSSYQKRTEKFIAIGLIYAALSGLTLAFADDIKIEAMLFWSTLTIILCLATGFDAVRDSINERINIQSSWLNMRIKNLENATNAKSGERIWQENGIPTDDSSHYYDEYPEKIDH